MDRGTDRGRPDLLALCGGGESNQDTLSGGRLNLPQRFDRAGTSICTHGKSRKGEKSQNSRFDAADKGGRRISN